MKVTDPKHIAVVGMRFGRLEVIETFRIYGKGICVKARCDCGNVTEGVPSKSLFNGNTKSCGCLKREAIRIHRPKTHGMTSTPTHNSWMSMIKRCEYVKHRFYSRYGGRGITVCERWHVFENFYADMGERPAGTSLDRIDNDGNYEPKNCRWSTQTQQTRNRAGNVLLTIGEETKTVAQWADERGISRGMVYQRVARDWNAVDAITVPPRTTRKTKKEAA